jgi:two-component system catabolic regulation response regulator CreB/two-component system response regulator ChvI
LAGKGRILIVDDEEDITFFLKKALENYGFEITAFNDPIQALDNFNAGSYDLVLLDIKMPKMDGFELYQKLKEIDGKAKVCFMTAFEVYADALKELFPDFYSELCFIKKSFSVPDFVKKISKEMAEHMGVHDNTGAPSNNYYNIK